MTANLVALLVVVLVLNVYFRARGRGYSNNQRVVLTVVAIGLLAWTFIRRGGSGGVVVAAAGIAILVLAVLVLRNRN